MRSFINKVKSIFIPKKTVWIHEMEALNQLSNGVKIIDNYGITEMGPCTVFTKIDDDVWSYTLAYNNKDVLVKTSHLSMPFAVLDK